MKFEDYLIASGVRIEPEEDNAGRRVEVNYKDIINKFKALLKNNARSWYSMYIEGRIPDLYSEAGWKAIKNKLKKRMEKLFERQNKLNNRVSKLDNDIISLVRTTLKSLDHFQKELVR